VVLQGENDAIETAAFSPDSSRILAGYYDGTAVVWDLATRAPIWSIPPTPKAGVVQSVAYSSDANRLIVAWHNGPVAVWDARTRRELMRIAVPASRIHMARFSPDGQVIATVSDDGTARLWDAATGMALAAYFNYDYVGERADKRRAVTSLDFSASGDRLVLGFDNGDLRVWQPSIARNLGGLIKEAKALVRYQLSGAERAQRGASTTTAQPRR